MKGLAIKDVAERTGIAAATIRMWEQRYGFPEPARTASGYRMYTEEDVEALRRVSTFRESGLSVPAALERARAASGATDRPSIYGAIAAGDEPVPRGGCARARCWRSRARSRTRRWPAPPGRW